MRALTSTLQDAQRAASAVPYVQVTVSDRIADVPRARWERLFTGAEPDAYHAATMPGDGSLLRLRVDPAGPTLEYQRVTDPDETSDYASWTGLGAVADAGVALAADGSTVLRAYVASNGSDIQVEESSDDGATFGSAVTAASQAGVVWLALAVRSNGDAFLAYADATTVYTVKRTGGSWGAPAAWPYSANAIDGLGAVYSGDFDLAIAGRDANDNPRLWTAVYGDGFDQPADTWSSLFALAEADGGSDVSFGAPFVAALDTLRLSLVEHYAGSVAYDRPYVTWLPTNDSYASNAWREPVPFDLSSDFGVAMTGTPLTGWLSTPSGVWRASLVWQETDLSDDVLELAVESRPERAAVRLTLRNDDGRYNGLPNGPYADIRPGAQLAVSPGYVTANGQEVSAGPAYWIEGWEYTTAGGAAAFVLHATDGWMLVAGWRARRQHTWAAGSTSIAGILRFIFGRAGLDLANTSASSTALNHAPDFTIHPGESGLLATRRLLEQTPDAIRLAGENAELFEPLSGDSSVYGYGGDHAIYRARYASSGRAVNRAQAFGDGVVEEAFDWADIEDQLDRLRQVHDRTLTTASLALDRATAVLRRAALALARGELVTPVNVAHELYDVIDVTDPAAGLASATYRIVGFDLRYVRRPRASGRGHTPIYEQRLLLGEV